MPLPYPVPYPGLVQVVPGPPQPVPMPVPMPVPVGVPIPYEISTPSTTTTTCKPHEAEESDQPTIKIYVPWPPHPWPSIPLFPNISFPFDSQNFTLNLPPQLPYHVPPPVPVMPMPLPMPAPPPLVMIPIPPMIKIKSHDHDRHNKKSESSEDSESSSSDSDDSDSDSSESSSKEKSKKKKKNKFGIYRSNRRLLSRHSDEEIKPVLTFESQNGDIKLQKRLSMDEAASLLEHARKAEKKVKLTIGNDSAGKSKVSILTKEAKSSKSHRRSAQEAKNTSQFSIGNGHKELVFKVPNNKTISNLTVSFDIKR